MQEFGASISGSWDIVIPNLFGIHLASGSRGHSGLEKVGMKQFGRSDLQHNVTSAPGSYLPVSCIDILSLPGTGGQFLSSWVSPNQSGI